MAFSIRGYSLFTIHAQSHLRPNTDLRMFRRSRCGTVSSRRLVARVEHCIRLPFLFAVFFVADMLSILLLYLSL